MRPEFGQALHPLFREAMARHLPWFQEVIGDSAPVGAPDLAFRWVPDDPLHLWVVLVVDRGGEDRFTVLLGWSRVGGHPRVTPERLPEPGSPGGGAEFKAEDALFRLSSLWTIADRWWQVRKGLPVTAVHPDLLKATASPEAARVALEPAVEDLVRKLAEFGMPYLQALRAFKADGMPGRPSPPA